MPERENSKYALRTIRILKEDLELITEYFEKVERRTLTAGLRILIEDFIRENNIREKIEKLDGTS